MDKEKRIAHIDLLETVAIFFVLLYHSTICDFDIINHGTIGVYLTYFFRAALSTCVPLFFFCNGYLLFSRPFVLKKHLLKMLRLVILVGIWALIITPFHMVVDGEPLGFRSIIDHILNLDTKTGTNILWFLGEMISMYFLFPLLKVVFDNDRHIFRFFLYACAFLTFGYVLATEILLAGGFIIGKSLGTAYYPITTMINPFSGTYGYSFVYFCIGGIFWIKEDDILKIPAKKRNLFAILGMFVSTLLLFIMGIFYSKAIFGETWDLVWNGYDTAFTFFNVLFIYILSLNYKKNLSVVSFISANTLGIYFIHEILIHVTKRKIMAYPFLCNVPANLLYAVLILAACLILCRIIRKIPILREII